jgi:benzylsuccinate CoA-transferase BbsF subunit/naphthyl-2-methylsuccinate CoA transferase subunit
MCPHGIYRCADDPSGRERWIAIAVGNDAQWESLCRLANGAAFTSDDRFSTLLGRRRNEDELNTSISDWTRSFDAGSLAIELQSVGVAASLVHDGEDMCEHDEHLTERGFYAYVDHPETDISLYDGPTVKLHRTPGYLASPAPLFGEHTYEVATEVLEYTPEEVAELTASGVLS